jgi:hypothetical protein
VFVARATANTSDFVPGSSAGTGANATADSPDADARWRAAGSAAAEGIVSTTYDSTR